jgi:hypothetical protein
MTGKRKMKNNMKNMKNINPDDTYKKIMYDLEIIKTEAVFGSILNDGIEKYKQKAFEFLKKEGTARLLNLSAHTLFIGVRFDGETILIESKEDLSKEKTIDEIIDKFIDAAHDYIIFGFFTLAALDVFDNSKKTEKKQILKKDCFICSMLTCNKDYIFNSSIIKYSKDKKIIGFNEKNPVIKKINEIGWKNVSKEENPEQIIPAPLMLLSAKYVEKVEKILTS